MGSSPRVLFHSAFDNILISYVTNIGVVMHKLRASVSVMQSSLRGVAGLSLGTAFHISQIEVARQTLSLAYSPNHGVLA